MKSEESNIEFHAVAEAFVPGPAGWPLWKDPGWSYIRLNGSTPLDQIGNLVLKLLGCHETTLTPAEAVDRIIATAIEEASLAGGVEITSPNGCVVRPGCCSGIEDRHDWRAFLETGESPWAGHDPSPRLERFGDAIRVWSDGALPAAGSGRQRQPCCIEVPVTQFVSGLDNIEGELGQFVRRLEAWSPPGGERLSRWFTSAFRVSPSAAARPTA